MATHVRQSISVSGHVLEVIYSGNLEALYAEQLVSAAMHEGAILMPAGEPESAPKQEGIF